jgi:predicted amidohydrolase
MRVAAVQTTAGPDRKRNLEAATPLVDQAVRAGAELVVLPEYFSVAGDPDFLRRHAEPIGGPTVSWASDLAAGRGIRLLAGSFPEEDAPGGGPGRRLFNTSCLIGPSGSIEAIYRKIHLFDVSLGGNGFRESATITAGDQLCVSALSPPGHTHPGDDAPPPMIGLSLCYDLRFPEMYRIMTMLGATVMAVPAAFTARTGVAHWELLLRTRATENQVFVIGAGQVGELPPGMPACYGHSMIVDPWGTVLAERTQADPGVVVADLDWNLQQKIRSDLPVLANRRPDAYRWPDDVTRGAVQSSR